MTLPRKLGLQKRNGEYVLTNYPLDKIQDLGMPTQHQKVGVAAGVTRTLSANMLNQSRIHLKTASKDFTLIFKNELEETLVLKMDSKSKAFLLDRMNSGIVDFQPEFGNKKHHMPIELLPEWEYDIDIYLDWSSVEVFMDKGLLVMTDQIFPSEPYNTLIIENNSEEDSIELITLSRMSSVWK